MNCIAGEYAERIDNADELLETFLETFAEEEAAVQLQVSGSNLTSNPRAFPAVLVASSRASPPHRPREGRLGLATLAATPPTR